MRRWVLAGVIAAGCHHATAADPPPKVEMVTLALPASSSIDCDVFVAGEEARSTSAQSPPPPPPPLASEKPEIVEPNMLNAYRVSGDSHIAPPDDEIAQLASGKWIAAVKLCMDEHGEMMSLKLVKSSRLPGWDRRLCERIRDWRYRPYRVNGREVRACTAVTFIFQMPARPQHPPPAPPPP